MISNAPRTSWLGGLVSFTMHQMLEILLSASSHTGTFTSMAHLDSKDWIAPMAASGIVLANAITQCY